MGLVQQTKCWKFSLPKSLLLKICGQSSTLQILGTKVMLKLQHPLTAKNEHIFTSGANLPIPRGLVFYEGQVDKIRFPKNHPLHSTLRIGVGSSPPKLTTCSKLGRNHRIFQLVLHFMHRLQKLKTTDHSAFFF